MNNEQFSKSVKKSAIGAIPYVGTAMNEVIFEYKSRLYQDRINHFIEEMANFFTMVNKKNIDMKFIKSDDFIDVFFNVIDYVVKTKSNSKIKIYRDLLGNNMLYSENRELDFFSTYLELIYKMNLDEICILQKHFEMLTIKKELEKNNIPNNNKNMNDNEIFVEYLDKVKMYRKGEFYNISEKEFLFYLQDMYSKGLLVDDGANKWAYKQFELMEITEFGVSFIEFLNNSSIS